MSNLLSYKYWFSAYPGPWLQSNLKVIYAVFGLLILAGLVAWLFVGKNKDNKLIQKFWRKVQSAGLTIGIIGLLLAGARQQRINFLSMPFLFALLGIGCVAWIYFIVRYVIKVVPQRKLEQKERAEKEKYLPK